MTVAELKAILNNYPDDAEIDVYGDYMQTGYLVIKNGDTLFEGE